MGNEEKKKKLGVSWILYLTNSYGLQLIFEASKYIE